MPMTRDNFGEENPNAKLTEDDVVEIRERYEADDVTRAELAVEFGVHRNEIGAIVRGRVWPKADGPVVDADYEPAESYHYPAGPDHPAYIPEADILDDLIAGYVVLDCWPRAADYRVFGSYSNQTIKARFGSYGAAIDAAQEHYEEHRDEWPPFANDAEAGA